MALYKPKDIPELKIANKLNLKAHKKEIAISSIPIPSDVQRDIEKKMGEYRITVKEKRHANAADKANYIFGKNPTKKSEKEQERLDNLKNAFLETKLWITEAKLFFWRCPGYEKLIQYEKEISSDYEKLAKKGYISLNKNSPYKHFDYTKYILDADPNQVEGMKYFRIIADKYEEKYNFFKDILNACESNFEAAFKKAETENDTFTVDLKREVQKCNDISKMYKQLRDDVEHIISKASKLDPALVLPKNKKILAEFRSHQEQLEEDSKQLSDFYINTQFLPFFWSNKKEKRDSSNLLNLYGLKNVNTFDDLLCEFYKYATSKNKTYEALANTYNLLCEVALKLIDKISNFIEKMKQQARYADNTAETMKKTVGEAKKLNCQINANYDKLKENVEQFAEERAKWEKDRKARKKQLGIFWAFAILSLLNGCMQPILGALTATVEAIPSPVDPMPASL